MAVLLSLVDLLSFRLPPRHLHHRHSLFPRPGNPAFRLTFCAAFHVLGIEDRDTPAIIIAMALDDLGMGHGHRQRQRPQLGLPEKGLENGYLKTDGLRWSGQRALEIGLGFRCYRLMASAGVGVYWCHLVSVMAVHAR